MCAWDTILASKGMGRHEVSVQGLMGKILLQRKTRGLPYWVLFCLHMVPTTWHLATTKDLSWHWGRMALRPPPDFLLRDTIPCLLLSQLESVFSVTCNQKHHNYYVQPMYLEWGCLNLANGSLWRRFKDKHVFPPFHPKYCFSFFKIIEDPVK